MHRRYIYLPARSKKVRLGGRTSNFSLLSLIDGTEADLREGREKIERWFDDTMERASGWYRHRSQTCLIIISLAVAIAFNVDSILIAKTQWIDDALRATVVATAGKRPPQASSD